MLDVADVALQPRLRRSVSAVIGYCIEFRQIFRRQITLVRPQQYSPQVRFRRPSLGRQRNLFVGLFHELVTATRHVLAVRRYDVRLKRCVHILRHPFLSVQTVHVTVVHLPDNSPHAVLGVVRHHRRRTPVPVGGEYVEI